jgi:hypothetical protein
MVIILDKQYEIIDIKNIDNRKILLVQTKKRIKFGSYDYKVFSIIENFDYTELFSSQDFSRTNSFFNNYK